MDRIYLDYAATTPVDRRVYEKMTPFFTEWFGNSSSVHYSGPQTDTAVDIACKSIAEQFNTRAEGVVFTSGGTESDNLALRGTALRQRKEKGANRIIISPVEHHAVLTTAEQLRDEYGFDLSFVKVDDFGRIDLDDLDHLLDQDTAIVSIIYANNEIGTINPMSEIAEICHRKDVLLHSDAVQAAAHLTIDLELSKVDMISIGAHKFYGPKGIGALVCRFKPALLSQMTGGKQEDNHRAGTHNVPSIVGMAEALKLNADRQAGQSIKLTAMRDTLIHRVLQEIPNTHLTGHPGERLPNHASFVFDGVDGNQLLIQLDMAGFACSSGSACKVGDPKPSDVLLAIGIAAERALGSLRVTLGNGTTGEHIERFCNKLPDLVEANRRMSA
jgi:cysteine desulfurase